MAIAGAGATIPLCACKTNSGESKREDLDRRRHDEVRREVVRGVSEGDGRERKIGCRRTDEQGARCKEIRLMESDRRRKKEWIGDGSHAGFNGKSEERKQSFGSGAATKDRTGRDWELPKVRHG